MSPKDNGETAFPVPDLHNGAGMSLRDYFAAKAMQAFFAGSLADGSTVDMGGITQVVKASYIAADEMLKAREA